ncbi:membrane-associated tyrosine- and threonine-specific cdc2-inhibitory kinase isoform X2 [Lethenteron reissneri]|uniref:membrane-associated tyrosine- and threonine-specific cdc2-inhibitory kinase isoform X2 n=1 Tax=Lethenteron reissneri TaxID=7753 RepID=UPI002AB7EE73|nr:membrane-associated tyrosine- and threonine-specific cdc2-inhibitory kinase isoform X2 [Lethenteron reissneri]
MICTPTNRPHCCIRHCKSPSTAGGGPLHRLSEAECQMFLEKRLGRTPVAPPRPPMKSSSTLRRCLNPTRDSEDDGATTAPRHWSSQRPHSVSFRSLENSLLRSRIYDKSRSEVTYFAQCFEVLERIGLGSFGEVFKVRSWEDGSLYAVKRCREPFRGERDRERKLEEVAKHERLEPHPNCVRFLRAWEEKQHLYIQTELCAMNLQQYCEEECGGRLSECEVWAVAVDLLLGLQHLHRRGLVHLDVKPANVFLSMTPPPRRYKLGDFGLVVDLQRGDHADAQEGDPRYLAPELLQGHFSKVADIFSAGMTLLEVACNLQLPTRGEGWQHLRQGFLPDDFIAGLSEDLVSSIRAMLEPDPSRRASVDELLARPEMRRAARQRRLHLASQATWCHLLTAVQAVWSVLAGVCHKTMARLGHLAAFAVFWPLSSSSPVTPPMSSSSRVSVSASDGDGDGDSASGSRRDSSPDWDRSLSLSDDAFMPLTTGDPMPSASKSMYSASPVTRPRAQVATTSTPRNRSPEPPNGSAHNLCVAEATVAVQASPNISLILQPACANEEEEDKGGRRRSKGRSPGGSVLRRVLHFGSGLSSASVRASRERNWLDSSGDDAVSNAHDGNGAHTDDNDEEEMMLRSFKPCSLIDALNEEDTANAD